MRHGAECFNFGFPQELDKEFLCVWDGISANPTSDNPSWKAVGEAELRTWLMDRVREGYGFPMNPVWAIRDPGAPPPRATHPARLSILSSSSHEM